MNQHGDRTMRRIVVRALHGTVILWAIRLAPCGRRPPTPIGTPKSSWLWQQNNGVVLQTPAGTLLLDRARRQAARSCGFRTKGLSSGWFRPRSQSIGGREMVLHYEAIGPEENRIEVVRHVQITPRENEAELVEEFALFPQKRSAAIWKSNGRLPCTSWPTSRRPCFHSTTAGRGPFPWRRGLRGQWQLGNMIGDVPSQHLALPVVQVGRPGIWLAAICADPYFSSLYELSAREGQITGAVRYRYASSKVPLVAGKKKCGVSASGWPKRSRRNPLAGRWTPSFA